MLDPIIKTIDVLCGQEKAFAVFVNEMGSWWPLDKRSMSLMQSDGKPAKSLMSCRLTVLKFRDARRTRGGPRA